MSISGSLNGPDNAGRLIAATSEADTGRDSARRIGAGAEGPKLLASRSIDENPDPTGLVLAAAEGTSAAVVAVLASGWADAPLAFRTTEAAMIA
jgi:hypothetical protein